MEAKKNKNANTEKLRTPLKFLGLFFTGSIVLALFSFSIGLKRDTDKKSGENFAEIEFLQEVTDPDVPEPITQTDVILPPDVDIIIDSNTQEIPKSKVVLPDPPDIKTGDSVTKIVTTIIEFPDVEASFSGGTVEMQKWIINNVHYPQTAIELNEQGRVYLSFVVEKNGTISNIKVERGVSDDLDKEAKRLLRSMPKWIAGEAAGKKARTRCRLPINFTLN